MQGQNATDIQEQAKNILGEQAFNDAITMKMIDLHRAYSAAYQKLDNAKAEAYKNIIVVRTLTFKQ
jgi:hypothetical protein